MTHCRAEVPPWRDRPMLGNATLTIVRSSWIRNWPSDTAARTKTLVRQRGCSASTVPFTGWAGVVRMGIQPSGGTVPPPWKCGCGRLEAMTTDRSPGDRPPGGDADLAAAAALVAEPSRARILTALLD